MSKLLIIHFLSLISWLCITWVSGNKPGCQTQCGNLTVSYPFGIGFGLDGSCSIGEWYNINCDTTFDPPKPFINNTNLEVISISDTQVRIKNFVASSCYQARKQTSPEMTWRTNLGNSPFTFSDTANKFTVVGCDDYAMIGGEKFDTGCFAACFEKSDVINGSCTGIGCCQTSIPKGLREFSTALDSIYNHANVSDFNKCGYAFLGEQDTFQFDVRDLSDTTFVNKTVDNVPVVLDWVVGLNETCEQAQRNTTSYACQQQNTKCEDIVDVGGPRGYRCNCTSGYQGNPYIYPGCTDIDECSSSDNPCSNSCTNTPGNYTCSCPKGYHGDGFKNGTGCARNNSSQVATKIGLGVSLALLSLFTITSWIYFDIRRKKFQNMREKFAEQNGGVPIQERS